MTNSTFGSLAHRAWCERNQRDTFCFAHDAPHYERGGIGPSSQIDRSFRVKACSARISSSKNSRRCCRSSGASGGAFRMFRFRTRLATDPTASGTYGFNFIKNFLGLSTEAMNLFFGTPPRLYVVFKLGTKFSSTSRNR